MVMLLVSLSDKGPAFYGHRRIGHNGQEFRCLKFRTMVTNGDKVLQEYLRNNPQAMEEWRATRKLQHDPRVTAVGAVLRKLSLDELPQLFNIIRGEISIVGPRPVVQDELEMYEHAAVYYLQSRPGLTGLWQVSGRNDVSYAARVAFDTHYVENWSLVRDVGHMHAPSPRFAPNAAATSRVTEAQRETARQRHRLCRADIRVNL